MSVILKKKWYTWLILLGVFLFPIFVATVPHGGSNIYVLLSLLSFPYIKKSWDRLPLRERGVLKALAFFFLFSCLSLVLTDDLREGVKRIERYLRLLFFIPIYFMLRRENIDTAKIFFVGLAVACIVMGGQAFYEVERLGLPQASGAYHKIVFGNLAILFSSLVFVSVFFSKAQNSQRILLFFAGMIGFYAAIQSGTRTAWIFVPVLFLFLTVLFRKVLFLNRKRSVLVFIVVFSIFFLSLQSARVRTGFQNGIDDLRGFQEEREGEVVSSWGLRLVMWRNSVLIFSESPLFGTGMGDFRHDSLVLDEKGLSYKSEFAVNQANAHSLYFQLLAEGGLIGLSVLLLALFVLPGISMYGLWNTAVERKLRLYSLCALLTLIGFAWFGVSESWVNRNPMITSYALILVIFMTSAFNRADPIVEKK